MRVQTGRSSTIPPLARDENKENPKRKRKQQQAGKHAFSNRNNVKNLNTLRTSSQKPMAHSQVNRPGCAASKERRGWIACLVKRRLSYTHLFCLPHFATQATFLLKQSKQFKFRKNDTKKRTVQVTQLEEK